MTTPLSAILFDLWQESDGNARCLMMEQAWQLAADDKRRDEALKFMRMVSNALTRGADYPESGQAGT